MSSLVRLLALFAATAFFAAVAQAKVRITVDLDSQTMHVESKDQTFDWKISSGKRGYETPPGTYGVLWMDKDHHSDEYEQAPMPNAIFFSPGFAIHGFSRSPWGHRASHGCIRLPTANAAVLFNLVKSEGAEIEINGDQPPASTIAARRMRRDQGPDGGTYDADVGDRRVVYDGVDGRGAPVVPPSYTAAPPANPLGSLFGQVN